MRGHAENSDKIPMGTEIENRKISSRGKASASVSASVDDSTVPKKYKTNVSKNEELRLAYNLVSAEYLESAKSYVESSRLITASMIETDFRILDDLFLEFEHIPFLLDFFDKDGWTAVLNIVEEHHEHAICPVCLEICIEKCICFDACSFWYHFDCYDATPYHKSGNVKKWTCRFYPIQTDFIKVFLS